MTTSINRRPRILIADNHRLVSEACKHVLEPEFEVIGVVADGRALVQTTFHRKPDVVVLEVSLPQLNGLVAADMIKRKAPSTKLVFVTANSDPAIAADAFRRGASGYVLKHSGIEEFVTAIRTVVRGESHLTPLIARETLDYLICQSNDWNLERQITPRQHEIVQLLAEGNSMKQVAGILNISPGTVAFHKYTAMEKLGLASNAELLKYAIQHHLTSSENNGLAAGSMRSGTMCLVKQLASAQSA